ncbi:MAG: Asp-tRNA(Asn)/Glu-tRNA(Gln) amidotransferase subunit GatB [Neisseriales bacterium]|nr:MAG: Asp-tRNA(Asn)/Glu-tRNA(Gln) amidotransferase subunit GatB [Neisseriales bacterium]
MHWETVIGLEVHVQLNTQSKFFSCAPTKPCKIPNAQVSIIDLAMPGVLPVVNQVAIEKAILLGLALKATINKKNCFARKNYFYPDLPKGYQISQMDHPIVQCGQLVIMLDNVEKIIRITRAHLEEDAGKLTHDHTTQLTGVDLNRAGIPLIEIVSEPDMCSAQEAVAYARRLHQLVTWLDISVGDMEAGNFRMDANVSIRQATDTALGTRREIKNLNSFRFLEQAIEYEVSWQIEQRMQGYPIQQATVLFDADTGQTRSMRSKENAHDYRYFPDPDLPPMQLETAQIETIRSTMPELPDMMKQRFMAVYQLSDYDASLLTAQRSVAQYFELVAKQSGQGKLAANWINGELLAYLNKEALSISQSPVSAQALATLIKKIAQGKLSHKLAKQVFEKMWVIRLPVDDIIRNEGLENITDADAISQITEAVIADNAHLVVQFLAGKEKVFNALVGQVMKHTQGKADPEQVQHTLRIKLAHISS